MEDILASIKRIIAEDSEATTVRTSKSRKGPVAVPDAEPDPTPPPAAVAAEPAFVAPAPVEEPAPHDQPSSHEPSDVLELTSPLVEPYEDMPMADIPAPRPEPAPAPTLSPAPTPPAPREETPAAPASAPAAAILSSTAETASRNAFAALSQLQVRSEAGQENTLEGLVADMLRPMLREWLDRELPGIVERLVEAEVKRVSGRG